MPSIFRIASIPDKPEDSKEDLITLMAIIVAILAEIFTFRNEFLSTIQYTIYGILLIILSFTILLFLIKISYFLPVLKNFIKNTFYYYSLILVIFLIVFTLGYFAITPDKSITIDDIDNIVPGKQITGKVSGIDPDEYKVAVYIDVNGWWNKPSWAEPLTKINNDLTWKCKIDTGGQDIKVTKVAAFIVKKDYKPKPLNGTKELPDDLIKNSIASEYKNIDIPRIEITYVPQKGEDGVIKGTISGVNPPEHFVAVYIYNNGWYNKPSYDNKLTLINNDGTWQCDITTDPNDIHATSIAAYLIPYYYYPPEAKGNENLPEDLNYNCRASIIKNR
jgi:hypothetical protein